MCFAPLNRVRVRLTAAAAVWVLAVPASVDARQPQTGHEGFAGAGPALVVQFQQPGFGGYFCCEAGGVEAGFIGEAGWFASRRVSLRAEVSTGRPFTDDLRAPRFVQQNRHHDWIVSGVAAVHGRTSARVGIAVLAGFGLAVERTTRTSRLLRFAPPAEFLPGDPFVQRTSETVPAALFGVELPIAAGRHVRVVPHVRARFLWRGDVSRFQDGLGPWMLSPGVTVRVAF